MADHLTEEEQIEALKRWWNEYWLSIVVPVVSALLIYGGWNYWADYKVQKAQKASDQYQSMVVLLNGAGNESLDAKTLEQLKTQANALVSDASGSQYADMANLILARLDVDAGEMDAAKKRLQQVVTNGVNPPIISLAKARLAKLALAAGNYDQALTLVGSAETEADKALFAEIRGDIYLAQGERDAANTAFSEALSQLNDQQASRRGLLQLKVDATAAPAKVAENTPEAAVETPTDAAEGAAESGAEATAAVDAEAS